MDFDPNAPFEVVGATPAEFDPNAPFEIAAPPSPSLGRRLAMGAGDVVSGAVSALSNPAAAIANVPIVGINTLAGREVIPEFRYDAGRAIADAAGAPRPVTPEDRLVGRINESAAGMIGPMGLARAAQAASGVAVGAAPRTVGQAVTGAFANNPGTDLVAGAVGGGVGGAIEQAGGNVVSQVAGDVAGNVITAAIIAAVARRRGLMPESVRPESITPEEIAGVSPEVADSYRAAGMSDAEIRQTLDAFTLANAQRERAAPGVRDPQPGAAPDPENASPRMSQDFTQRAASPRDPEMPRAADAPVIQEPPQTFRYTEPDPNVEFPGATTGETPRAQTAMGRTPFPDQGEIIPPSRAAPGSEPPPRGPIIDGDPLDGGPAPRGQAINPETTRIKAQIGRLTARGEPEPGTPAADQVQRLRQTLQQIERPRASETPQGQGTPVRAAPREVGGAEGTRPPLAGGAAQEVGAPPRVLEARPEATVPNGRPEAAPASWVIRERGNGRVVMETFDQRAVNALNTERYEAVPISRYLQETNRAIRDGNPPQQGAPDAAPAQAPMARPPEAPAANVSAEAPRAMPDGVTVYRDRAEFQDMSRRALRAEAAIARLTKNGEPAPGTPAARQLEKARATADLRARAVYDPEAPEPGARNAEAPAGPEAVRGRADRAGDGPTEPVQSAPRRDEGAADGGARTDGSGTLYANPLADPAAWKRFLADPIAGTIGSLRGRLKTSPASIGTTPGVGAAWRLYADSARATLLHYRERYASVAGMRDLVENLGGTDPGSGRRVAGGYQETADATARSLNNRVATILRSIGNDTAALGRVRDILTGTTPRGVTAAERAAAGRLRTLLDEHHAWLTKRLGSAEKEMGYVRGRYFPRRFDAEAIQADLDGFTADATALYRRMGLDAEQARMAADEWGNRVMGIGGGARYADTPASAYTKGRTLPPDADTLMRKWLVTDPREALAGYLEGSTRHAEFVSRFGPNGQKFDEVLKGMRAAGATPTEIDILRRTFASATGTTAAGQNPTTGLLSWTQMWGMRQLLTRALFSSAMEPISVGLRSGSVLVRYDPESVFKLVPGDSLRALGDTWRRFLTPDSWQGDRARMETERAEMLGVVGDATREMLMAARVESQNLRTRDATRINQMLTITGQNRLFAASRIAASRIAEHTVAKLAGDTSPGARRALAEIGMNDADATAVAAWLRRHDGKPPVAELTGDTPAANAYRTAVNRFVNESVVNPLAVDRPTGAGERHPMAQLGYGIMSFQYAFTRNVLIRAVKSADGALRGGNGLSAADRMALLVPLAGMGVLAAAQMGMSAVRDQVFNRQAKQERPPFVDVVLGMDRAGLFGNLSPLVNLVTSAKYERDASGALAGAYLGNMLRQAGDIGLGTIPQDMGGPNSPRTNNAEWAATRSAWGLVAAPAMVGMLAAAPIPAWAKPIAGAGAMYVGSSDMSRTVADTVAGPRTQRARTPGGARNGLRGSGGISAGGGIPAR
jgi:hypothetical protein